MCSVRITRVNNTNAVIMSVLTPNGDTAQVLVSYSTPVAAFIPGTGYVRTEDFFSVTTSRHINRFLRGYEAEKRPQTFFDDLLTISIK